MAFSRAVLSPKDTYDSLDRDEADAILALRRSITSCDRDADYVLRLRRRGPFVVYTGTGADAGKRLFLSFLNKPAYTPFSVEDGIAVRLAFIAPEGFAVGDRVQLGRLIGRTVRDGLNAGADVVYWYVKNDEASDVNKTLMQAVGNRIGEVFPEVHVDSRVDGPFTIWEARL